MVTDGNPGSEEARLKALKRYDILDTDPEQMFDDITRFAAERFDADIALISLVDEGRQWFKSAVGLGAKETPRDAAFCAHTVLHRKLNYVPDARLDPRFIENPLVTGAPFIRFYCGAPLITPDGYVLGSLCVIDSRPRAEFSETDRAQLQVLANMIIDRLEVRRASLEAAAEIETRILAEQKAIEAEDQMRVFVEHVPIAIALVAKNGEFLARSARWQELQSRLFSEWQSENFHRAIDARSDWTAAFRRVLKGRTVYREEDELLMADGTTEYAKWEARPWYARNGSIEGGILSITLITEQVLARKRAEEQSELFNAVLENIDNGIVACDASGQLTLFNAKTRRLHGLDVSHVALDKVGEHYSLYEEDGITPLTVERIPLFRALKEQKHVDQPMVISPSDLPRRDIWAKAMPLYGDAGKIIGAVASMTDVTESKLAARQLRESEANARHVAFHDPLTGLPNRAHFDHYCNTNDLLDETALYAAVFVDLNRFKLVNDTYGHKTGDELLTAKARLLRSAAGESAFLARLGGDEFVAVLPVSKSRHPKKIAASIAEALNSPVVIDGTVFSDGASVGFSIAPDHGNTLHELIRRADIAMYQAKSRGVKEPVLFDVSFESAIHERNALEKDLYEAIVNDELHIAFQPIVCSEDRTIRGMEGLLRWNHPVHGPVPPSVFIPIAEENGFIIELGNWAFDQAVRQIVPFRDLFLSFNLSPVQFRDPSLVKKIEQTLEVHQMRSERLELEITEGLLISDTHRARRVINAFRQLGIKIALDDFGIGYSSLSYLHEFPFNKIKIDRAFVKKIGRRSVSASVIAGIVTLANSLDMVVTAEGVETLEQEKLLQGLGCQTLQGFKYGQPAKIHELVRDYALIPRSC